MEYSTIDIPTDNKVETILKETGYYMPWLDCGEYSGQSNERIKEFIQKFDEYILKVIYSQRGSSAVHLMAFREIFYRVVTSKNEYCKSILNDVMTTIMDHVDTMTERDVMLEDFMNDYMEVESRVAEREKHLQNDFFTKNNKFG
ncbi:hypothetical protein LJC07_06080 [Christensenellaceae bacterium OttesenSCG-928-L17]|nr:hypothetical protein [Christensenellaceae bacterium OttesenSCG-928-L17]